MKSRKIFLLFIAELDFSYLLGRVFPDIFETNSRRRFKTIKSGLIFFADGYKSLYRSPFSLGREISSFGTPLKILANRLGRLPGFESPLICASDAAWERPLIEEAEISGMNTEVFRLANIREKPVFLRNERWKISSDKGEDSFIGAVFAEIVKKRKFDRIVVVPVSNLLVDRAGVLESLELHVREGFDATFSEDRSPGANWAIFQSELLLGLQTAHPEIMEVRGGISWALRKPLYPFRIGEYHSPRDRASLLVDLRLNSERVYVALSRTDCTNFDSPSFSFP